MPLQIHPASNSYANYDRPNTASKDHDAKPDSHTSADLDLFEAFLNSPRESNQQQGRIGDKKLDPPAQFQNQPQSGHNEHETLLLGADEYSQPTAANGEVDSLQAKHAFEIGGLPSVQESDEPDKSFQLPFEPQLAGTAEQLKVSEIHAYYLLGI